MALFRNRPLASAICCFLIISLIGVKFNAHIKIILLLLTLAAALFFATRAMWKRRCSIKMLALILCLFAVAAACFQSWLFFDVTVGRFSDLAGQEIVVEGYVCETRSAFSHGSRYGVRLREVDGKRISAKVLLECEYLSALQPGDCFRLTGKVRLPENTAHYEEETMLYADGYVGIVTCEDYRNCTIFEEKEKTIKLWFSKIQKDLSFRLYQALGSESGPLASALFLGDRSYLSDDTALAFQRGGVSHLLALSGLHISIMFLMLDILLKLLPFNKNSRTVLVFLGIVLYLFITGCSPSTLRAVVMLGVLYGSYYVGHDYDGFTTLCIVAFLILTVAPYSVFDLSFWLSFVATAGILIFIPVVGEIYKNITKDTEIPKGIRRILWVLLNAVAVGLFANTAILPLSAYLFGSTSVLSIILTMILSPLISLALLFSALTLVFPSFGPIVFLTKMIFRALFSIVAWGADIPNVLVLLDGDLTWILLIALTALLILFAIIELNQKGWLILPFALSFAILLVGYADVLPREMGVVASYVSTGYDEAVVLAEGKTAIAVDFSKGSTAIARSICNTVTELKCTELRELILTHYHSQSASQIASLCGQIKLRILRLPVPRNENDAAIAVRLEQEAVLHDVKVLYGTDEPSHSQVQIIYYHALQSEDSSEGSVLFSMDVCGQRITYMNGDVWQGEIAHLARDAARSSDLFIFGAHGTQTSVSVGFFENLRDTDRVIFGRKAIFELCPRDALAQEYWVEIPQKQFSFPRTAQR